MAAKTDASAHPPEVIGNAFLEQYYTILAQYPENVHKFYQNASVISRPAANGSMSSTSTLEGINKMILSLNYKNSMVEILTADSQVSYGNGIIVLVIGYFIGKDNMKRKFSQLFFLVPQEANEYFVLNDVFRYVDEDEAAALERDITIDAAPAAPITQNINAEIADHSVTDLASTTRVEDAAEALDSNHPLDNGKISLAEEAVTTDCVDGQTRDVADSVLKNTSETDAEPASDSVDSSNQEDAPKKSYASVQEKNCFGFVEFESAESMQSAFKVASIMIGNRNAHIEEKKAINDGAKDQPPRRGGFRNDNFKSRWNFAGRGYGRNEGENQERYSGHPRSNGHGGGEGYYKNYQNGVGRAPRQFQEQDGKN